MFLLGLLTLNSCRKPDQASNRAAQIVGNWTPTKTTSLYVLDGDTTSYSEFSITKPCELDNYLIFSRDGGIAAEKGPVKCDSTDPQSFGIGRWELAGNSSQLYFFVGNFTVLYDILQLDAKAMTLFEKAVNHQSDGKTKAVTEVTYYKRA